MTVETCNDPAAAEKNDTAAENNDTAAENNDTTAAEKTKALIAGIWRRSRPIVKERVDLIDRAAAARPLPEPLRVEAMGVAHKLAGSLGMFGFEEAGLVARELEELLGHAAPEAARLAELAARLRSLLADDLREV